MGHIDQSNNVILGGSSSHLAALARDRIRATIADGRKKASSVIESVLNTRITDIVAHANALRWGVDSNGFLSLQPGDQDALRLHRNALRQAAGRVQIPVDYVDRLTGIPERWGRELVAHTFREIYAREEGKRLLRTVNGEVRGFLSDRYRRRDTGVLIESFVHALQEQGALPYDGHASDTRISIQALLPQEFEPIPNEVIAYGVSFEDSSFGNGPTAVSLFVLRGVCLNGLIATRQVREIHVGGALGTDIAFAEDTMKKDTEATALKIRDTVRACLGKEYLAAAHDAIRRAHAAKIDDETAAATLKRLLSKKELEAVMTKYADKSETITLPEGQSRWRLVNALSWLANQPDTDGDKKVDLQTAAGELLGVTLPKVAA